MRASTGRPALCSARQYSAAQRLGANVPFRCTRITASHSASSMLKSMRSRRIPALLTSDVERAERVDRAVDEPLRAVPVGDVVGVGDRLAAGGDDLVDDRPARVRCRPHCRRREPPRSLTTTLAPCRASSSACPRPIPRPAPVTIATRPSQMCPVTHARLASAPCGQAEHALADDVALHLRGAAPDRARPAREEVGLPAVERVVARRRAGSSTARRAGSSPTRRGRARTRTRTSC